MRGMLEFLGSAFLILALKIALNNSINQGLTTAMMTLAGLLITLMSRCFYQEKLNLVQGIGMFLILGAVVLMGVFQEFTPGEVESTDSMAVFKVIIVGIAAALCFSIEAMFIKWLCYRGVEGPAGGQITLFFDGVYGLIMLAVITAMGDGLCTVDLKTALIIFSGGVVTSIALVLVNYAVANGISGVAFSVANSFPVWHVLVSWLMLDQAISAGQAVGVGMAIFGGFVLSLQE